MFAVTTPLVLVAALVVAVTVMWRNGVAPGRLLAGVLFTVYVVGVANFVILPLRYDPELARAVGPISLDRLIELKPFFFPGGQPMSQEQLVLNVLLTVPFGFGLPFIGRIRARDVPLIGVLVGTAIELAQLTADALYLALPTWSVDVNDVLLNAIGVWLGYIAFIVSAVGYARGSSRWPGVRRGLWVHFHDTLVSASRGDRETRQAPSRPQE